MAKRALVIANSQYDDERFAALPAAKADAAALAGVLSDPAIGEFTVEQMVDIGQRAATRAIQLFFSTPRRTTCWYCICPCMAGRICRTGCTLSLATQNAIFWRRPRSAPRSSASG